MSHQLGLFQRPKAIRVNCARCGRQIVVSQPIPGGVHCEYNGGSLSEPICWGCKIEAKHGAEN